MPFDYSASHNMSENDTFNVPMGIGDRNAWFMDGMFSNSFDLNNRNPMIDQFPTLPMLQGEPMDNAHAGFTLANHNGLVGSEASVPRITPFGSSSPISSAEAQERFLGGSPISAASLASLLTARCASHDHVNELACSVKASTLNEYSDALNSAFATSMNCGYDGLLNGMGSKWDFDKFLPCPELSGKIPGRTGPQTFELMGPNEWISPENANLSSDNPSGSSKFSNELSLSLPTRQPSIIHGLSIPDQCSEISSCSLKERPFETSCNSKTLSLSSGSCRPAQLSQFLSGSRYLRVIQEILAEIASYTLENLSLDHMNYSLSSSCLNRGRAVTESDGDGKFEAQTDPILRGREVEAKKKQLLALLQMVDEQYNQCVDEIHTVISAFHAATELDPRIHARFALQAISALYKNLRERISNQILAMGAYFDMGGNNRVEENSFETSFIQRQWALQQLRRKDHQLWRPQRGLPERSVSVLRAWMFQNFLHPYPKDAEKHLLAMKSGLTRSQVSNWFINARVRLWKPMIEEMYAEMNRQKGRRSNEEIESNHGSHLSIEARRFNMN